MNPLQSVPKELLVISEVLVPSLPATPGMAFEDEGGTPRCHAIEHSGIQTNQTVLETPQAHWKRKRSLAESFVERNAQNSSLVGQHLNGDRLSVNQLQSFDGSPFYCMEGLLSLQGCAGADQIRERERGREPP